MENTVSVLRVEENGPERTGRHLDMGTTDRLDPCADSASVRSFERSEIRLDPTPALLREIAASDVDNALLTPSYARARQMDGHQPVGFFWSRGSDVRGCVGFLLKRPFERVLEIESIPVLDDTHPMWSAILEFCRRHRVTELRVNSYGTFGARVAALGPEISRRDRCEFVLDLNRPLELSTNHRRNIRKAQAYGLKVVERIDGAAGESHARLIGKSQERRRRRGEEIYGGTGERGFRHLLESGAAVVFQAVTPNGTAVSSILVVLSARSAYYHSAGTAAEGMAHGAASFLVSCVAGRLANRGVSTFNLGGASETQEGLARFKRSFGAREETSEAAFFDVSSGRSKMLVALSRRLPARLRKRLGRML